MQLSDESFKQLSQTIATMRFPLVVAILCLHAMTATRLVGHTVYHVPLYPIAYWFGDTGVPAYFFISSLLLFYSSKSYFQQIKTRAKTLLIPYLIWNGLYLLVAYLIPFWIFGIDVKVIIFSQADFSIWDYLRCFWDRCDFDKGNFRPILTPMWYIRNLIILYLLSPVIYYIIRVTHLLFPAICCFIWINDPTISLTWQSLTMFSLGAVFPVLEINPMDLLHERKFDIIGFFVLFGLADCITHMFYHTPYDLQIHRLALIANTFFCLWLGLFLHRKGIKSNYLSKAAFFLFCTHYPLMQGIRAVCNRFPHWHDAIHIFLYFLSIVIVTGVCLTFYNLLNRYAPRFLHLATGDRG